MTAEPYAVRKAREIAAQAWDNWDNQGKALCVCGHTASNHLGDGCRVVETEGMCNCSCFEMPRSPARRVDSPDPYGPTGMGDGDYVD